MSSKVLFQRLYNWIKYKTLPPSTLFKNRLYIERDSKHKRIFNNFGLIFRNSKWTTNEKYNVKTEFRLSFYKYFFLFFFLLFLLLFLVNFSDYYLISSFFNLLSYLFWFCRDTLTYYFSFLLWLIAISGTLFSNILYSYFFFNNFSENENIKKFFSNKFFSNTRITEKTPFSFNFSKNELNWIFYSWFDSTHVQSLPFMEKIFNRSVSFKMWERNYNFFSHLYQLIHFTALIANQQKLNSKALKLDLFFNFLFNGDKSLLFKYYSQNAPIEISSCFHYFLVKNFNNNFDFLLKKDKNKNLSTHNYNFFYNNLKTVDYDYLLKKKNGPFFLTDFSIQQFNFFFSTNSAFFNINENFLQQLSSAKWDRWIYRYSLLHRKIIKNFHKVTITKKLLNSGFYDQRLFDKNIWASTNLLNFKNANVLNSLFHNYYPIFLNKDFMWGAHEIIYQNTLINFNLLNFHENSYFWIVKRFFFFNNLNNQYFFNKKALNACTDKFTNNFFLNDYYYFNNFFFKNRFDFIFNFNRFRFNFIHNNFFNKTNASYNLKDLFVNFDENTLFNLDNLKTCYWVVSPFSFSNNNENFNFFTISTHKTRFSKKFHIAQKNKQL